MSTTPPISRADNPDWFKLIPAMKQRQDGTTDQLNDLLSVANRLGMYDAADVIKAHMHQVPQPDENAQIDLSLRSQLYDRGDRGDAVAAEAGNRLGDLGREVAHWQELAAYLASCHAASLESLPKSAPKSLRTRLVTICSSAANALRMKVTLRLGGNLSGRARLDHQALRCETAVRNHST
jgi:hypothetical protein